VSEPKSVVSIEVFEKRVFVVPKISKHELRKVGALPSKTRCVFEELLQSVFQLIFCFHDRGVCSWMHASLVGDGEGERSHCIYAVRGRLMFGLYLVNQR